MASFVFNNLLQSPLKGIARGHRTSWGIRPIPAAIWPSDFRQNHEKFGRPCSRGWTTPKSSKDSGQGFLRASLPCWWTPVCGLESTVGSFLSYVRAPSLAGRTKVLPRSALGPMATVHLPKCPRCTAGCLISLLRARKRGETFQWLWRQPKP